MNDLVLLIALFICLAMNLKRRKISNSATGPFITFRFFQHVALESWTMVKDQKGQALVELALSLVILWILVFGIIDFGRIMHVYLVLDHSTREGARVASLGGTDTDIVTGVETATPTLSPVLLTIRYTPQSSRSRGTYASVSVSYPVTLFTPIFAAFMPNPFIVRSETVMRIE